MAPGPVQTRKQLSGRLRRFWHTGLARRTELHALTHRIKETGSVYAFGGLVRDIARKGIVQFRSDVDLVVDTSDPDRLFHHLAGYKFSRNKFGGCRVQLEHWSVDVWPARTTWAFSQGHSAFTSPSDLLSTTFFNWDAALYNIESGDLSTLHGYLDSIRAGHLDINLEANPNPAGMALRTWRLLQFDAATTMPSLTGFLYRSLQQDGDSIVEQYSARGRHSWVTKEAKNSLLALLDEHLERAPLLPFFLPPQPSLDFQHGWRKAVRAKRAASPLLPFSDDRRQAVG